MFHFSYIITSQNYGGTRHVFLLLIPHDINCEISWQHLVQCKAYLVLGHSFFNNRLKECNCNLQVALQVFEMLLEAKVSIESVVLTGI